MCSSRTSPKKAWSRLVAAPSSATTSLFYAYFSTLSDISEYDGEITTQHITTYTGAPLANIIPIYAMSDNVLVEYAFDRLDSTVSLNEDESSLVPLCRPTATEPVCAGPSIFFTCQDSFAGLLAHSFPTNDSAAPLQFENWICYRKIHVEYTFGARIRQSGLTSGTRISLCASVILVTSGL